MTAITQANDARLLRLQTLMDEAGSGAQFTELDPFGERHGSWQRTIHSYRAELDRYVLVALTNLEEGDEIAVSAGAEERIKNDDPTVKPRFRRFAKRSNKPSTNCKKPATWRATRLRASGSS